ncbi:MAG TPA: hypothetical protein VHK69_15230 [Chitinophagaceae bacterium]|nr:hypothetical protein [Chitinophagaceae bacterium]
MSYMLIIGAMSILSLTGWGQSQNVDSLIGQINDQQVVVRTQYVWFPQMFSPAGDQLIKIGKPATGKLVPLLNDTSKGIIVHYLLAHIWREELGNAGQTLGSSVYHLSKDTAATLGILFTDFIFYQDGKQVNFSSQAHLDSNRQRWIAFFRTKIFRQRQPIGWYKAPDD